MEQPLKLDTEAQRAALERELEAMRVVSTALLPLNEDQRRRVLRMVCAFFGLSTDF